MELNWSTFILEIINFLVLVWLLQRFLYKPVLGVLEKRRAAVEGRIEQARQLNENANRLKAEYENRLADWQEERRLAKADLDHELAAEKTDRMRRLQLQLEKEREKAAVIETRQREAGEREMAQRALRQGVQFVTRLLERLNGPELESRLLELTLEELAALPAEALTQLRSQWGDESDRIIVTSSRDLNPEQQQQLTDLLRRLSGIDAPVAYQVEPDLLAGVRISIGGWLLQANLRDELESFAEFAHDNR